MTVENNKIIKMTFWELISSNDVKGILIPIIQRDYAQGREGKDFIRKNLLEQLMEALDPTKGKSEEPTELDFVYGTEKDGYILPLDGQQRLTTLWLFYWFVAYKSDNLKKNKDIFKKFSYETRTSAREFCEKLCELVSMESDNKTNKPKNISEHIKNQPWFYSVWSQDPTVDSMLRMISGEKDKDNDCIEKVVKKFKKEEKDREREYFDKFWKNLTINDCPIKFNFLKISSDKIRESDDLYIKMNARGKPLTDFENFKADFIDDIKDLKSNDEAVNFASLLDNLWTNVFWENRTINGKIDEIFFTFLNRFFLNYGIVNCELNEESEEWNYLYGDKSDDTKLSYDIKGFFVYKRIINEESLDYLKNFFSNFSLVKNFNSIFDCCPKWSSGFDFIPKYVKEKDKYIEIKNNTNKTIYEVTNITQPNRVVFYGICKYFENFTFDKDRFSRWMRIVYNLTENTQIDTIDAMIGRIKLIDELSAHIDDIYDFLADDTHEIVSKASTEQIKEERIKAKQIIEGGLEEKINEAENVAFFKGAIRFLYYSSKTSNNVDWSEKNFGLKLKTAKQYFSDSGVSGKYKENAILLRSLVSHVDFSTRDYGYWNDLKLYFNNESSDTWKRNLLADGLQKYISELFDKCLTEEELKKFSSVSSDPYCKYVQNQLVNTELLNNLDKFDKDCRIRWNWERFVLHPDNTKSHNDFYYVIDKRNELLAGLLDIECEQKVKDLPFYWGKDINFKFCGHYFRYCFERKGEKYDVCLMETGWKAFEKSGENYIGFEVTPDAETSETLKNKLENLKKDK